MYRVLHNFNGGKEEQDQAGYFAVYDGHGGRSVSRYLYEHLDKNVARELDVADKDPNLTMAHVFAR